LYLTEYTWFALTLAFFSWVLLSCVWLVILCRPGISAVLSLMIIGAIIVLSQFKWGITYMTATFLDVLVIDSDTVNFLIAVFPQLRWWVAGALLVGIPALIIVWR